MNLFVSRRRRQHPRRNLQFYTNIGVDWERFHRPNEPAKGAFAIVAARGDGQHFWESFWHDADYNHALIYVGAGRIVEVWNGHVTGAPIQNWIDADPLWSDHQGNIELDEETQAKVVILAESAAHAHQKAKPTKLIQIAWLGAGVVAPPLERADCVEDLREFLETWTPDDLEITDA